MRRGPIVVTAIGVLVVAGSAVFFGCDTVDRAGPGRVAADTRAGCPRAAAERLSYDGFGEMLTHGALPADVRPVRALHCTMNSSTVPSDPSGSRQAFEVTETRTSTVPAGFLQTLTWPDRAFTPWRHGACSLLAMTPQWVILVDATGRAVIPRLPQDPCGETRVDVATAVADLGFADPRVYRFEADAR